MDESSEVCDNSSMLTELMQLMVGQRLQHYIRVMIQIHWKFAATGRSLAVILQKTGE